MRKGFWVGVQKVLSMCFFFSVIALPALADAAAAGGASGSKDVGGLATSITGNLSSLGQLIISASLIAGMGFALAAILKFKQHKDNPTQITVGTPIALVFIAAALMFMPSVFSTAGATLFGGDAKHGDASGKDSWIGTSAS